MDDNRCRTPQFFRKDSNACEVYSGPPSVAISSGTPKIAKLDRRILIVIVIVIFIFKQPLNT